MTISAALVKQLRERTGAGMMECKKALIETSGDIDAAVEVMRKAGLANADKKAGRVAAEGRIVIETDNERQRAVIVEVNSETDFVSSGDQFREFANGVAHRALTAWPENLDALMSLSTDEHESVDAARRALIASLGENINVRRFAKLETDDLIGSYLHNNRIGVAVAVVGGDDQLARDIAMHIAASQPLCVAEEDVPQEIMEREGEILRGQAQQSGKPADIIEKMVAGRLRKYLSEITLLGQPFVKDPDKTVGQLLAAAGARVTGFVRYAVGEGIEKREENFAEEVMAQVKGA